MRRAPWIATAVLAALLAAPAASADSALDDAKAAGHVGEQLDGYLGVVSGAPAGTAALVRDINSQRREKYQQIARENGTDTAAVAALAGQKLVERTPAGQYHRNARGDWVKR